MASYNNPLQLAVDLIFKASLYKPLTPLMELHWVCWSFIQTTSVHVVIITDMWFLISNHYIWWFGYYRTRVQYLRADQFYASYPGGIELLTGTAKVYPIAWSIMEKFHLSWRSFLLVYWFLWNSTSLFILSYIKQR